MIYNEQKDDLALDCLLLAGQIMMESGAETYRVEDTMIRMAHSQNLDAQSYVTPTGIILTLGKQQKTKIISIASRITDLHKIAKVNNISRKLTLKIITLEEAYDELRLIQKTNYFLPFYLQIFMAAVSSACFLILFKGTYFDMPAAFVAGGAGYSALLFIQKLTKVKFFSEFFASFIIALSAFCAVYFGYGLEIDKIIISAVMPLVPGVLITNAVRDMIAGHLTAGIAKGTEALLTAFSIGSGVAVVLVFI